MIDPSNDINLRWLKGIVAWDMNVKKEHTTSIWGFIRSHDLSLPMILIIFINWSGIAVGGWILLKINELFLNSLDS